LNTVDNNACLNVLFALEGAIQGIRWHILDDRKKNELKEFYDCLKKRMPDTDNKGHLLKLINIKK
jgi:predicted nucleic acid-binding OB-fold protein